MGEHLFRVQLDELSSVRVCCAKCKSILEVAVDQLATVGERCPCCPQEYTRGATDSLNKIDRFKALQRAISDLLAMQDKYAVEFTIRLDRPEQQARA